MKKYIPHLLVSAFTILIGVILIGRIGGYIDNHTNQRISQFHTGPWPNGATNGSYRIAHGSITNDFTQFDPSHSELGTYVFGGRDSDTDAFWAVAVYKSEFDVVTNVEVTTNYPGTVQVGTNFYHVRDLK